MSGSSGKIRPVISVAIRPKENAERKKLLEVLGKLVNEDPALSINLESSDRQIVISGMGESHLQIVCDSVLREHGIELEIGEPKVIYLETIRISAEGEGKYIRQTGGRCDYAHVKLRLEPGETGSDYKFVNETKEDVVPLKFLNAIDLGIREAMKGGILAGCEMVDLRAVLRDGSYHEADSNEMAFKIAAAVAFQEAAANANPVLLEPLMLVSVATPEEFMGVVIGDLNRRRGRVETIKGATSSVVIEALAPLAEMLGHSAELRAITQGQATAASRFASYDVAPRRSEPGEDDTGVTANKPRFPTPRSGSAAADVESE